MNFRYDINGLRAIAVIAVVLFHFNPAWVPGGFAGVDVFFVISGFLMTSIIFRGLEDDNFKLFKFYVARANRIIPALAVLCLVLLVFGWFYLTPVDYRALGKHVASSMGFLSNVIYWRESGYFDAASHEKWLLHTWSLSVEWQFYILYPIVLVALKKFLTLENLKRLIVIGTILGFVFSVIATMKWPNPAYYLLPTRAWEMMMGGVAFLYPWSLSERKKKLTELIGLTFILGSYAFVSEDIPWPGHFALIPVLGAYLMIVANQQSSVITNNKVFQYLGKWSYSIYLWHWPIVVFFVCYGFIGFEFIGVLTSLLLGFFSFKFIESVKFKSNINWTGLIKTKSVIYYLMLIVFSCSIIFKDGYKTEFRPISLSDIAKIQERYNDYDMDPSGLFLKCNASLKMLDTGIAQVDDSCFASKDGGVFLWGDSHMGALSTGLRKHLDLDGFSQLTSSGCGPSFEIKRNGSNRFDVGCDFSNGIAFDSIVNAKPSVVILGMANKHESNDWENTINILQEVGVKNIIVIGPFPQWSPSLPSVYTKRHMGDVFISDKNFNYKLLHTNDYLKKRLHNIDNVKFIDMIDNLCFQDKQNLKCRAKVGEELIVFDYGHLTTAGSEFIAKEFVLPNLM
jgi:peptidoglycan/LPS O-acetylase OafA/YrhL